MILLKLMRTLVIGSSLILISCSWFGTVVKPVWEVPDRPKIEIGKKERADRVVKSIPQEKLEDYVIMHKNELKKDTKARLRLKIHIEKLENIIKGCQGNNK